MRLPKRLVWRYHPAGLISSAVFVLAVGMLLFVLDHAPFQRCWLWCGGGVALGFVWVWLVYVRFPAGEKQLQRAFRGGPEEAKWWWWLLWVPLSLAVCGSRAIAGKSDGPVTMGVSFGLLVGLPWWWRKWRAMNEAWERWGAAETAEGESVSPLRGSEE